MVANDFLARVKEIKIDGVLAAVDTLRNSPYWQKRKIGLAKFLREETFLKLHDGSYDWNPDTPKGTSKNGNPKTTPDIDERVKRNQQLTPEEHAEWERRKAARNIDRATETHI
jgi:hypothetical protein